MSDWEERDRIERGPFKKLMKIETKYHHISKQTKQSKQSNQTRTTTHSKSNQTMSSSVPMTNVDPVVASATKSTTPKTLPMKSKSLQCGIVGFLKKMYLEGEIDASICESLLSKLPLLETVEAQVKYYDENYDLKHIEQTYIKPRIQEYKKSLKPVKEKKPRAKKAEGEKKPRTKKETTPVVSEESDATTVSSTDRVSTPVMPKKDALNAPEKPVKKPRAKKAEGEKKPRGRKAKETEVVFSHDEDEEATKDPVVKNLDEDLKAEEYVVETEKKPVEKKKRAAPKKKVAEKAVTEVQYWLIMRDDTKYWTTDEHEKNGDVYSYNGTDEDGDPSPKKRVGKLVDGVLVLEK
tara:strand:+ start:362 stop:1411 length:1050 start_codon:yes stop_codon:yes gene_type:complete